MADDTNSQQPEAAPHVVRVTQYEDSRGFAMFHRETVQGDEPAGFFPWVVVATVGVETPQGVRPLNVQGPILGATDLASAVMLAREAADAAANAQIDAMRKQALDRPRIVRPDALQGLRRQG